MYPKPEPGAVYARLTVVRNDSGRILCRCACGAEKTIAERHLTNGATRSCGCLRVENGERSPSEETRRKLSEQKVGILNPNYTFGFTGSPTFGTWCNMHKRCAEPGNPWYGGKGIAVCARWTGNPDGYYNFVDDMGLRPDGMVIDRIDSSKDYEPSNCRWLPGAENSGRAARRTDAPAA